MERQKLILALIAPGGVAVMGLLLGIDQLFIAGACFTGLVLVAAVLRKMS